ncbi:hypothetical protein TNCV_2055441 [Trichonephila clavipes]|uniref:Uncharacterized protein n=1 Tax=Trichonephila clavipes TaxID=2585209 RepID=A0A8X6RP44_TRICX|nr:hypothetical protein TNCV_2055441 [Trichonephila clavipes]
MTDLTYSHLRIVRMPSPVQSNCDAHDTIANGQYGAVWSMGYTQQVCVRIVLLPSNVWQQFFVRSAFLRQQETDLPPAELCAVDEWLVYRASIPQVRGSNPELGMVDSAFDPFSGSINECQACLGT